jgi:2-methylisocitrate lyase-like PEP mutase family enzyme
MGMTRLLKTVIGQNQNKDKRAFIMLSHIFKSLHNGQQLLVLPNAWDAGSARLIESRGAAAIATTSAGLAWSHGYPDGDALPAEALFTAVREISRAIRVPLSVDIEGGYSNDPIAVAKIVAGVIRAGAVGINIEDGSGSPEILCAKLEAARQAASREGVDLFINVRTDVFLRSLASGDAAVEEVIRRSRLYRDAGCDGIFVPALAQAAHIKAISAVIGLPLNIMLVPGLPSFTELYQQGVRRLSAGSAISQAALALTARLATNLLAGSSDEIFTETVDYGTTNQLFSSEQA